MRHLGYGWVIGCVCGIALPTDAVGDPLTASQNPQWSAEKAAHLLRRAGFGGTPEQIKYLTQLGRDKSVDLLIHYENTPQDDPEYPADDFSTRPPRRAFADLGQDRGRELFQMLERIGRAHGMSMQDWWLRRMTVTSRPLEEKMTLFWHGHFTSGMREVKDPRAMYQQNQFLRANAMSDFKTLLRGISRDRAMLIYLDNARNVKAHPNENYARELLELFTLGEGHYTENDVKEAARAFTGWSADENGFRVRRRQHDSGEKTFLGRTGNLDGDDVIDVILEQPAAARFLARKLWMFFVDSTPDNSVVDALAARLRTSDYNIRDSIEDVFRSNVFYAHKVRMALIKSPTELIVGSARLLETPLSDLRRANEQMQQMGQQLFQPPNVKGWDGGRSWINTSTLFVRYNSMAGLLNGSPGDAGQRLARRFTSRLAAFGIEMDDNMMVGEGEMGMAGPAGWPQEIKDYLESVKLPPQFSGQQAAYDPKPVLEKFKLTSPEAIVEHYVQRLLQMQLPPERKAVLIQVLAGDERGGEKNERIRKVIHLIMSMPEYQLN